jgi:hypothetical protein
MAEQQQSVLDQAMGNTGSESQAPAQTAPQGQATGGSVLDQAMQGTADKAKSDSAVVNPTPSNFSWLEQAEGATIARLLPEDNKVLDWVNKHIAQPPVRMGQEVGNILANQGLGIAGKAMHANEGDNAEVPKWAEGNETAYWRMREEQDYPGISGIVSSLSHTAGELLGNPTNWPLMGAAAAKSTLMKSFTKVFGLEMAKGAIEEGKGIWENWDKKPGEPGYMDREAKFKAVTDLITHAYFARQALKGHPRQVEGPETATGEKPQVSKAAKPVKVAGEVPVTQTHAGVEVPVSAQQAESVNTPRLNQPVVAPKGAQTELKEFQRTQTAPAATGAIHSVLGQSAEDLINQHDAILNGDPSPDSVVEQGKPSKYTSIDDAANALNTKARQTTYAKADEISQREQAEWQHQVEVAHQNEQSAIDHYNEMVDEHNANLEEGQTPMEHETFDPSKVRVPERPKTYGELKGAVDRAYADLKSSDAEVRENAVDAIDKAEKQLEGWFKQHSDEIPPEEYTSAKKLVYAGARYQEIANGLRNALENDTLTGNKLRGIIAAIDTRMIKRGEAPGAFRRLVGEDVYNNWRKVSRLFDPIQTQDEPALTHIKNLGKLTMHFVAHHLLSSAFGLPGFATHWFMDKVLSSPAIGDWFSDMAEAVRNKYTQGTEIPTRLLERWKGIWEGLKNREEGATGARITPRGAGSPVPPKFGRAGLGTPSRSILDEVLGGAHEPSQSGDESTAANSGENRSPEERQTSQHEENGGSTFSPEGEDLTGRNLYSVGSYPERTRQLSGLTPEQLQDFKTENADVLSRPNHAVGTWKDGNKHVLDVAKLYGNRDEAIAAGRAANQKSIYHLGSGELIDTGGTGEVPNSVRDVVSSYNKGVGKPEVQDIKTPVNPRLANAIADAYDQLKHDPKNPKVKRAYNALIKETVDQWHALEDRGYRLEVKSQDPYGLDSSKPAYQEMAEDIKNNRRIQVWDGGKPPADHPLSQIDPETGLTYNTLFRAVHDIMGHVAGDNDFSQQGEENAYQRHAQSYSKEAIPALTTETRGQTSHYFNNEKVRKGGTPDFVDQRAALLPERFYAHPETMEMHHWSNTPDLTETNPEFMGSGKAGREMARSKEPGFLKRTNFALEGYREPAIQGQKFHYVASANPLEYYNAEEDADGIWRKAYMEGGPTAAENAVRDAGYKGYRVGNEVASFGKVPVKSAGVELSPNASGESAASQEAINRQSSEKAQGIKRVKVLRNGQEVPLIGPDAVDASAGPGETIVKRYADGHEEIQDQGQGARYNPRDPQAEALKRMSATNDNDWMAQAKAKLRPDASFSQIAMEAAKLKTAAGATAKAEATPSLEASEIATRRPTSKRVEKTNAPGQYADMNGVRDASQAQPGGDGKLGYAEKLARTVSKYSGLIFTDAELKNPRAVMEKFVNHLTDNLVALHDAMPEPMREIARQWYDTAHKMAGDMAQKHGVTRQQAAGVLAALSPQNAWDNNVALGDRLLDTYKNRQNFEFSPKMEAITAKVKQGQLSKAARGILRDIQGKTLSEIANQSMPERLQKKWGANADTKWENVKAAQQAMWVRLYDEAHNSAENPMFHPSGEVVGVSPSNRSWIGLDHVAKAIRIINDGSVENINNVMGDGNKIRNFYNNIINPDSENGHVTVDTHAVGAAHFQPFSGDDPEVQHNFGNTPKGIPGAPKHAATGMRGTYPLYAEAYRRAAERLGVKPRELQSMTWEGIRSLMGDDKKTSELKASVRDIWKKVQDRELTIKQAREMIIEQAGGFSKPSWMTDEQWDDATGAGFNPETFAAAGGAK